VKRQTSELERWLAAKAGGHAVAVILGTSWNALSFARSLGRRGVPVLLLESKRDAGKRNVGSYTRYGKVLALPAADDHPETWIEALRFVGARLTEPGVLMSTGDADTLLVSRHQEDLRPSFRFAVPARATVEQIVNKRLQYAVAQEAGIPIPATYFPESVEEVRELAAELPYPCLLKPYTSHVGRNVLGRKLAVARSADELVSDYVRLAARETPAMVQEIVPGGDRALFGYLAFWDSDAQELAWVTTQKLRQSPPGFGDGSIRVTVEAPDVVDMSRRLLRAFDYSGFAGVEFKLDATTGKPYLMEVNPRTESANQLAISAGVDLPWIGYRYLTGFTNGGVPNGAFRPGVKFLNEEFDVAAYRALRRSHGMTIRQWARSIRGTTSRAIWDWDDPRPFLVLTWRLTRPLRRKARRAAAAVIGRSRAVPGCRTLGRIAWRRPSSSVPGTSR
jgi:predicted ATP-grasp superfamily ATP-dependent carboligase